MLVNVSSCEHVSGQHGGKQFNHRKSLNIGFNLKQFIKLSLSNRLTAKDYLLIKKAFLPALFNAVTIWRDLISNGRQIVETLP